MTQADVPAVIALEQVCFPTPWAASTYRSEIRNRTGSYWVVRPGALFLPPGTPSILAYGGMWLLGDEAHITTIASHPKWRRRHLGEWLLLKLIGVARSQGVNAVTLEVRVGNTPAIALYTKLGFVPVGVRKGYYQDTNEDARLLTLFAVDEEAVWTALDARRSAIEAGEQA